MSESQDIQTTEDVALAAFVCVYESSSPVKVTTDISEPFTAAYHFRMSHADWKTARDKYAGNQAVVGIQTYVQEVRKLQSLANKCDRQGGVLSL